MTERLIAIGDIHGCYDHFRTLVEESIRITKSDRLVLLGDYIDRGFQSKEVIDYIIDLKGKGYDIIPLIGNHESMLLESSENGQFLSNWYMNGGYITLFSFGIESIDELSSRYLDFFMSLPFYYSQDQFLFVHAGFNDDIIDPFEDRFQMIWSRRETYANPVFDGKTIVHGHTPIPLSVCREEVLSGSKFLNIDTGCVYEKEDGYGHLTALELITKEIFSV